MSSNISSIYPGMNFLIFTPKPSRKLLSSVFRSANFVDNGITLGRTRCDYVPVALKRSGNEGFDHFVLRQEKLIGLLNEKNVKVDSGSPLALHENNLLKLWSSLEFIWEHEQPRLREGLDFYIVFGKDDLISYVMKAESKVNIPENAYRFKIEKNRLVPCDVKAPSGFSYTLSVFNWLVMDLENKTPEKNTEGSSTEQVVELKSQPEGLQTVSHAPENAVSA